MVTQFDELTDTQWQIIAKYLPVQRKRELDIRHVVNAIFYVLRTGCQWRNLPKNFPHWQAVYYYFDCWKKDCRLEKLSQALNKVDRKQQGREETPSLVCVDSQSVKLAPSVFEERGLDTHKKVNGRKRQIMPGRRAVDSGGRIWRVFVHAANESDSIAGCHLLWNIAELGDRLGKVLTDCSYRGRFEKVVTKLKLSFEVASKPPLARGFVPVKIRWVVERTFSWLNRSRDRVLPTRDQGL